MKALMAEPRVVAEAAPETLSRPEPPDRAGFEAFYRREYSAVVALVFALSGSGAMAEDIAQEAFLVTHQRWAKVAAYERPRAFVRRVAANMAVSQRRRLAAEARAKARLAVRAGPGRDGIEIPDPGFWAAVRSLPRRQAQVLALYYLEDRSPEEIGLILGCTASTVRVHLHRGRAAMEKLLGPGADARGDDGPRPRGGPTTTADDGSKR
jgi:RNA polymerase sigma-70 factor (ECF subfamily)